MRIIVFTAQAFGFGPVSKMLAISESIKRDDVKKIFFGSGVAYDLARIHNFDEIHYITNNEASKILPILQKANLFINVMDFSLGKLAKIVNVTYFLIDSLYWFWGNVYNGGLPAGVEYADKYFCQRFFESSIAKQNLSNIEYIGVITNNNFKKLPKINQAVINFGGGNGKVQNSELVVGKNSFYPVHGTYIKQIAAIIKNTAKIATFIFIFSPSWKGKIFLFILIYT